MFLTRKNLNGGRRLVGLPLHSSYDGLGYKLGYCSHCNEPISIRQSDTREVIDFFGLTEMKYKKLVEKYRPRVTFKEWLIKWLGGYNKPVDNS